MLTVIWLIHFKLLTMSYDSFHICLSYIVRRKTYLCHMEQDILAHYVMQMSVSRERSTI